MLSDPIFTTLDPAQRRAVLHDGGPLLLRAGAGAFCGGARAPGVPWVGPFHAFGAILLRRHGGRIGLSPRFVIYDTRDQHDVLKRILKDLNVDEKKFPPAKFGGLIERAERGGVSVEQAALSPGGRGVTTAGG